MTTENKSLHLIITEAADGDGFLVIKRRPDSRAMPDNDIYFARTALIAGLKVSKMVLAMMKSEEPEND